MYKIFMLIAVPVIAIGWAAYYIWDKKMEKLEQEEKKMKKGRTTRSISANESFDDFAEKMKDFKKTTYDHLGQGPDKDKEQ